MGSFTRYYSGDWELVAARVARELGAEFSVVRQHNPHDAIRDPEEIHSIVLAWRDGLAGSLSSHLLEPLDWDESPAAPYFTDKPAWDGYHGLLLWAAYQENPQLPRPAMLPEDFGKDAAILRSMGTDSKTAYRSLLSNVQFWLPARLPFVFEAPGASGKKVTISSSVFLAQELNELNRKTWNMNESELDQCAFDGCEAGSPLEVAARFGFALFRRHALLSVAHRLPMLLDW
ncbi:MAG TPA: hypothetical protein VI488_12595 [Candidatus Angelobacter sp.]